MPKETRVTYQNKGFWIPEGFVVVLSQYICNAFETIGLDKFSPDLIKIYHSCDGNRTGEHHYMVGLRFDNKVKSSEDARNLIDVLEKAKAIVLSKGTEISISELNQFESEKTVQEDIGEWTLPIKTKSLATTLTFMQQLIDGSWSSSNYAVYYEGFPNPSNCIEI